MCKFCRLRAILKSTILRKTFFFYRHDFECKYFSKKQDFEWKILCRKHDFELKTLLRVRFWTEENEKRQILIWKFYNLSDFLSTF